ncbi:MAG TPA: hypothetical protein PK636_06740 [bacterium]|nr:hypothetical protein [bacterium]HPJ72362.1 hypothetical protein [bacterium]HPQ66487.1 hypothetical protein [bacterium]
MKTNRIKRARGAFLAVLLAGTAAAGSARAGDPALDAYRKLAMSDPQAARQAVGVYNLIQDIRYRPNLTITDRMVARARDCIGTLLQVSEDPKQQEELIKLRRVVSGLDGLRVKEAAGRLALFFQRNR